MEVVKGKDKGSSMEVEGLRAVPPSRLRKIIAVASIAAGIQFGWALQFSLLTPYVQLLGIPHTWASYIWLCGPISGMLVQPTIGYYSDRCTSRFGRRRPFIAAGTALVTLAVFLIGFAADLGQLLGDDLSKKAKPRAIVVFVIGFWILDVANNMLQGPCRALLADLSGSNSRKTRVANSFFSFFVAVGSILGYAAGAYKNLYHAFPFTKTKACDVYCANLKSCFLISVVLLLSLTTVALTSVHEKPLSVDSVSGGGIAADNDDEDGAEEENQKAEAAAAVSVSEPFFGEVFTALKDLPKAIRVLMLVTGLNSLAWFPFVLFDTDWMGKEVYGGTVGKGKGYNNGVHAGALGLMLNSIVLGFTSLGIEFVARRVGGVKRVWGAANFLLAICLSLTVLITKLAEAHRRRVGAGPDNPPPPPAAVKAGAWALFSILGIPLAITYSIPFALASIFSNAKGAGQGLSLGVLNVAIVVPQLLVSVAAGPWDKVFGGGNLPAFVAGAVAAAASGILALTILPSPPPDQPKTDGENTRAGTASVAD